MFNYGNQKLCPINLVPSCVYLPNDGTKKDGSDGNGWESQSLVSKLIIVTVGMSDWRKMRNSGPTMSRSGRSVWPKISVRSSYHRRCTDPIDNPS